MTHLGRELSLEDPHHRILIALVGLGALAGWMRPVEDPVVVSMVEVAATVALTWMLIREISPDGAPLALAGAALAGATVAITGATSLVGLAGLAVSGRILSRSTGRIPLLTDVVVVGLFAGIFARRPLSWAAALAVASAVALDTNQPRPAPSRYTWLAGAIGVAVTMTAVFSGAVDVAWKLPDLVTMTGAAAAWLVLTTAPTQPIVADDQGEPFERERIRSTRLLALGAATLGTMVGGGLLAESTWPVWIALIVSGLAARMTAQPVDSR